MDRTPDRSRSTCWVLNKNKIKMSDTQVPLLPTHYYHIYNHAIGRENFFERDADYDYFLKKAEQHLNPVCTILSYCLLPNHFHFVVQIDRKSTRLNSSHSQI